MHRQINAFQYIKYIWRYTGNVKEHEMKSVNVPHSHWMSWDSCNSEQNHPYSWTSHGQGSEAKPYSKKGLQNKQNDE